MSDFRLPFLSWKSDAYLFPEQPEDFILEHKGSVRAFGSTDDEIEIGRFSAFYVDFNLAREELGFGPYQLLETHSAMLFEYFPVLFEDPDDTEFSQHIYNLIHGFWNGNNLLILDRLEFLPEYRGQGLGLVALTTLIKTFAHNAGVVAIKVFPIQFEHEPRTPDQIKWRRQMDLGRYGMNGDIAESTKKLQKHYKQLGFVAVPGHFPFMVRSTATALPLNRDLFLIGDE